MGVLDSGATRCAGGLDQLEYVHECHLARGGSASEPSESGVRFRFAGGDKSQANAKVTMWCGFMEGEPLDVHALQTAGSPTLLGMDFLQKIGVTHDVRKALILFADGRCAPLTT